MRADARSHQRWLDSQHEIGLRHHRSKKNQTDRAPAADTQGAPAPKCWASGHTWLYAVWVLSYVTPFPLFVRIRSMAEHACTEVTTDMFRNTRTTHAGWLARATVAPVRVNYHIEHHVLPGVPYFRLPLMHRWLRERGAVPKPPGYLDVLRIVSSRTSADQ